MTASVRPAHTAPGILDSAILALLVFDGILTAVLAVLFLPVRLGTVPFPVSVLVAGVVNVLLVLGARTVTDRTSRMALPVIGWFVGIVLCMSGPGGDGLLLADWRTLLLLVCGLVPAGLLLLKFASDAAVARGTSARPS